MGIPCFLLDPTDMVKRELQRWRRYGENGCPGPYGYHYAVIDAGFGDALEAAAPRERADDDPEWPSFCDSCEYEFTAEDGCRVDVKPILRRADTLELFTKPTAPAGAMWLEPTTEPHQLEGGLLIVKLPNGRLWYPDNEAANCTRKGDRSHFCWIIHGTPPALTIDKQGETCRAGAGSIQSPAGGGPGSWHGFLRNGELVPA